MKKNTKTVDSYEISKDNIFSDLGLEESDELMARANLLQEISSIIKLSELSQKEIGAILGISQPKVSMLVSEKLSAFSTETLMHYLSLLGCSVEIRVTRPNTKSGISKRRGRIAVHQEKRRFRKAKPKKISEKL